jgi:SAM-dependent methyltransferase
LGRFDLVHSTYALPFSREPEKVIADVASLLNPGGIFLLTTGHPVYAGEWIELSDDDEQGVFLPSYFHPPPDHRPAEDNHNGSESCSVPPSTVWSWLTNAGLTVDRFLEPEPLPIPDMTEEDIQARVPYESDDWRALYPILSNVPTVAIFRAIR